MPKENKIRDLLKQIYAKGFMARHESNVTQENKDIDTALSALKSAMMEMLPEEEKEENLCHCEFDGNPYIDEKENLIKCKDCGKQIGHKFWNACITETKARVDKLFEVK